MMNDRLAELMSRRLSGEATTAELQELHNWLQANPGDQYYSEILLTYWQNLSEHTYADTAADQHFAHILEMAGESDAETISRRVVAMRWVKRTAVAAVIAGAIGFGISLFGKSNKHEVTISAESKQNEVVAGRGIRTKMVLPDGTQVWLNSDSKLQYSAAFSGKTREVTLEGEGYFDVVKDASRPFIVHTSKIDIHVLGTAFNVKSYPQEKTIEATLIHGLIEVVDKDKPEAPKIILRPKEKIVFTKGTELLVNPAAAGAKTTIVKSTPDIAISALPKNIADSSLVETSWVYNRLILEGETFADAAIKMERWYNVKIHFKNERIANRRIGASFEDENIEQALKALQYIAPFNFKINNNEVEITK